MPSYDWTVTRTKVASRVQRLVLVVTAAIACATLTPAITWGSQAHLGAARSEAGAVALRWAAQVPATARVGAEPPGRCRALDGRHAACPIAIVVLARDAIARRPWRCSTTVLIVGTRDQLAGQRTNTRCAPFPLPSAVPDPAAALGTALALDANGDIACLPASDGWTTCVMRYVAPNAKRCMGAASVPLRRPERSIALGAPVCQAAVRPT